jgi:hypothetical protein
MSKEAFQKFSDSLRKLDPSQPDATLYFSGCLNEDGINLSLGHQLTHNPALNTFLLIASLESINTLLESQSDGHFSIRILDNDSQEIATPQEVLDQ